MGTYYYKHEPLNPIASLVNIYVYQDNIFGYLNNNISHKNS